MTRNISGGYVDKLVSTDIGKSLEINSTSQLIVILPDRWMLFYCLKQDRYQISNINKSNKTQNKQKNSKRLRKHGIILYLL